MQRYDVAPKVLQMALSLIWDYTHTCSDTIVSSVRRITQQTKLWNTQPTYAHRV